MQIREDRFDSGTRLQSNPQSDDPKPRDAVVPDEGPRPPRAAVRRVAVEGRTRAGGFAIPGYARLRWKSHSPLRPYVTR